MRILGLVFTLLFYLLYPLLIMKGKESVIFQFKRAAITFIYVFLVQWVCIVGFKFQSKGFPDFIELAILPVIVALSWWACDLVFWMMSERMLKNIDISEKNKETLIVLESGVCNVMTLVALILMGFIFRAISKDNSFLHFSAYLFGIILSTYAPKLLDHLKKLIVRKRNENEPVKKISGKILVSSATIGGFCLASNILICTTLGVVFRWPFLEKVMDQAVNEMIIGVAMATGIIFVIIVIIIIYSIITNWRIKEKR